MSDMFRNCVAGCGVARMGSLSVFVLLLFCMAGCAGTSPVILPANQAAALRHNQRGVKAEATGDHAQALEEFSEALRLSRAIEHTEGIVVALVNSSRVQRHNGDVNAALALINRALPLVAPREPLYPEVAFEMAQVMVLAGESGNALEWAAKSVDADAGDQRGMRINLLARILYRNGTMAEAETRAREALLLNSQHGLRDEEANSLRLLGDLLTAEKRYGEAAESYNRALAIDKDRGASRKIAADMRGLARLSLTQNDTGQALGFYQRACAVSSAGGDRSAAADDLLNMSGIHEKRGEKELAERMLSERDRLLKKLPLSF